MKSQYVIVVSSSDGDVTIQRLTREQLSQRLKEHYWGNEPRFLAVADFGQSDWLDLTARGGIVIIDGDVIVPKPKQVVVEYEV